jgi:hypothetical protein
MINNDMNIVEFTPGGGKVYDSYSTGYSAPIEDTSLGGTNDLKNIKFSQENGQEVVTYERAFNTGDKYDKALTPNTLMPVSLAWGRNRLAYHETNKKTGQMLIPDGNTPIPVDPVSDEFDFWEFHGIIMTVLWTAFSFLGYVFARFFKHLTWWIWMHRLGSGMTALISVGVLGAAINLSKFSFFNRY